jgi:hypothetical protein
MKVLGEIDRGHPTAAQLALERVAIGEGCLQTIQLLGHGG